MQFRSTAGVVIAVLATIVLGGLAFAVRNASVGIQPDGRILIPTGQQLTPAGDPVEVNDRPLGMKLSPDGNLLAVVTGSNFNPRALHIIDAATRTIKQTLAIGDSFVGVDFSPDGRTLYVGGGRNNDVKIFTMGPGGTFAAAGSVPIAESAPSGLDVSEDGSRLYVALNMRHAVGVIDTATRTMIREIPVGIYPYTTVLSKDGSKVYVSNWGGRVPGPNDFTDGMFSVVVDRRTGIPVSGTVSVIDTASNTVIKTVDVELHPSGMALSSNGDRVYVTNANSDTVSAIDTATDAVLRTLSVQLHAATGGAHPTILGSSPNAVAVSPEGSRLYVANASENAVAVLDPDRDQAGAVLGLIPTGWYSCRTTLMPRRCAVSIRTSHG
jgi:YVTN family beta-propeller protein